MGFQAYCLTFCFFNKPRTVIFAPFWGFGKKGVSLVGIRKYWDLFFCWAGLVSSNFKNFIAEFWFEAVY
jgi:hypothetical protein